ncbi:MAG: MFS transporter, partial [Eubacterium sp.]|nr:MFS transporter [Eubacterium sp.]
MAQVKTYTKKERNMYLTGLFGQNMIYNIVATGLYYYFQNVICLPAIALGWIFAIARVWDAVNDPIMGTIVDKTRTRWGKCRPYLLFSPIIICVITCVAFLNGNYAAAKAGGNSTAMILIVAWAAVSYILWGMCYTVGDIPLWGIISRMSEDEKDRATLISLARIVAAIGAGFVVISIIAVSQAVNG